MKERQYPIMLGMNPPTKQGDRDKEQDWFGL